MSVFSDFIEPILIVSEINNKIDFFFRLQLQRDL